LRPNPSIERTYSGLLTLQAPAGLVHHDVHHPGVPAPPPDAISETVALLEALSRRAADLAAALPALDLDAHDLNALAGEVQRINDRLVDAEERLAFTGPAEWRGV